jgi:hypothetical protein
MAAARAKKWRLTISGALSFALLTAACDRNRVFSIGNYVHNPKTGLGYAASKDQVSDLVWLVGESHPYMVSQPCPVGKLLGGWETHCWFADLPVTWRSLDPSVAKVDPIAGPIATVTAIANGRTNIDAVGSSSFQTLHDELHVHVATPIRLKLQPKELALVVGRPVKLLRMDLIDQDGNAIPSLLNEPCAACSPSDATLAPPAVTWKSSNEKVARVSRSDTTERLDPAEIAMLSGVPTWRRAHVWATGPGTATIVGEAFGLSAEVQVTVPEVAVPVPPQPIQKARR